MASYGNVMVKTADPTAVARALRQLGRTRAWIAPAVEGWTTIFDPDVDKGRTPIVRTMIEALSQVLRTPAWAVVCLDDDVLVYWLARGGRVVDHYDSWPGYFGDVEDDRPRGGDPRLLTEGLGVRAKSRDLLAALDAANGEDGIFPFAVERHEAIVEALGLPTRYAFTGWQDVMAQDAQEEIPGRAQFISTSQ